MQMGPGRIAGVQILNEMANIGRFLGYTNKPEAYTNINKISGSLNIQNGVATTNDLLVDSVEERSRVQVRWGWSTRP